MNVYYAAASARLWRLKHLARFTPRWIKARTLAPAGDQGPRYHLTKTKTDRREPAFLICTDPNLPLEKVLQYYLWRWDIEVNFRDEKTILGVGQAQVRTQASNQNAPALAVAAYAILLLASLKTYGAEGKPEQFHTPRVGQTQASPDALPPMT